LSHLLSTGEKGKKAHLVDLELPDECPNIFLCHSSTQMPTIPLNFYMIMLIPRKHFKHSLPLTRLHIPA
jgi:hypothetical protein